MSLYESFSSQRDLVFLFLKQDTAFFDNIPNWFLGFDLVIILACLESSVKSVCSGDLIILYFKWFDYSGLFILSFLYLSFSFVGTI